MFGFADFFAAPVPPEEQKRRMEARLARVEQSQSLVEFILPEVRKHMSARTDIAGGVSLEVIVIMPTLKADVALVDIFPSYGHNDYEQDKLRASCKDIGTIWCWGSGKR